MKAREYIEEVENNMRLKLKSIAQFDKMMMVDTINTTQVIDSGMPTDTFNTAFGGKVDLNTATKVMNFFNHKKHPMAWWIGPSSVENGIEKILTEVGFKHTECDVGMACQLNEVNCTPLTIEGLVIKQCMLPEQFLDFGNVLASIFDPVDEHVQTFYQKMGHHARHNFDNYFLYVGYINNEPVATAALYLTNVAGIYDISTKTNYRKRGYGTALFQTAVQKAQALGIECAVLQASPNGLGLYKKAGFQEICEFNIWSNQGAY